MIPSRIKSSIENSPLIANIPGLSDNQQWESLTRTVFERIARKVNHAVTQNVLKKPFLLKDFLLFGEDEFENILFKYQLKNMGDFIEFLKGTNDQKPYIWISGKTLQSYWRNANAKDKKLNVLLTFLDVDVNEWDTWKVLGATQIVEAKPQQHRDNGSLNLIRKHFVGHYYRYYQKTDTSETLVKAPFLIKEHNEEVVIVETKTMGHQYKSSFMIIRDGALYIDCENLDWNEKESYIFNLGFESNPTVITGVSNTLNRKGQAIAIKNVLVKQATPYDYNQVQAEEIAYAKSVDPLSEEARLIAFFKQGNNIISTPSCYSLEELAGLSGETVSSH